MAAIAVHLVGAGRCVLSAHCVMAHPVSVGAVPNSRIFLQVVWILLDTEGLVCGSGEQLRDRSVLQVAAGVGLWLAMVGSLLYAFAALTALEIHLRHLID